MKKTFCDRCDREIEQAIKGADEVVGNFKVEIRILKYAGCIDAELCSPCVHALTAIAGNRGSPDPLADKKPSDALLDVKA